MGGYDKMTRKESEDNGGSIQDYVDIEKKMRENESKGLSLLYI